MKAIFNIIILGIFISCMQKTIDSNFESDFKQAINTIDSFEKIKGPFIGYMISDSLLVQFYFSQSYLNHLTGTFANVQYCDEIPYYTNREIFEKDKAKWLEWYKKNKYKYTKEQSDSIKKIVWDSHIWW